MSDSIGKKFQKAIAASTARGAALPIVGTINAYVAMMATEMGFEALYLSGAGVANAAYGLPDVGIITLDNVLEEASRITAAVDTPLLVDIDTGFGSTLSIQRSIQLLERLGVAAIHIEDQPHAKRCGHLSGKQVISTADMCQRIQAAVDARKDTYFTIMARTDALAVEGLEATLDRAAAYAEAGADMIFAEAFTELSQYTVCRQKCQVPLLANMTEFGQTPLFTAKDLAAASVDMILYPLSANRAMNLAALAVFAAIKNKGTQIEMIERMQTREELYAFLHYEKYENKM